VPAGWGRKALLAGRPLEAIIFVRYLGAAPRAIEMSRGISRCLHIFAACLIRRGAYAALRSAARGLKSWAGNSFR